MRKYLLLLLIMIWYYRRWQEVIFLISNVSQDIDYFQKILELSC